MLVGLSSRESRPSPAVASHMKVTVPYQVPHLDMFHAFLPMQATVQLNWINCMYKVDFVHLTNLGHRMVAFFVLEFFMRIANRLVNYNKIELPHLKNCNDDNSCQILPNTTLKSPIFISSTRSEMYEKAWPFYIDFRKPLSMSNIIDTVGFQQFADSPNKIGYIGTNVSSHFTIRLFPNDIKQHVRFGQIELEYLASYENIGKMYISITSSLFNQAGRDSSSEIVSLLASREIDCKVDAKVSIAAIVHLPFNISLVRDGNHCIDIKLIIVDTIDKRPIHKVKIMYFTSM